jgi:agmatinase
MGTSLFGDFPHEYSDYASARVVILPIPYEKTTTYGRGCSKGPEAIIAASCQLEYYDEILDTEPYRIGIYTAESHSDSPPPEELPSQLHRIACKYFQDKKLLVGLGGEHAISLGLVLAALEEFADLAVLHVDAHADLRDSYEGTRYGHGCVLRRISEHCPVFLYGIRSLSVEERDFARSNQIPLVFAFERNKAEKCEAFLNALPENVYLSIDMDALDPSQVPGVGTPEPGGMFWEELMEFLNLVNCHSAIIGFDVVEVMPLAGQTVSEFTAAKLIYRLLGMIGKKRGWL